MGKQAVSDVAAEFVRTGVAELDDILGGGLLPNRFYLIEGNPGSGKTTFALQFLIQGRVVGEKGLYITFSETKGELEAAAESHGWSLDGIEICELATVEAGLNLDNQYTMFQPSEVELNIMTKAVLAEIEAPLRFGWSSTRSPKCSFCRRARFDFAIRSWLSNSFWETNAARS